MFDLDEIALITRTKQEDTDAFNPLVEKYQSQIYTFIRKQVKEVETAKDLMQETWLKAFRAIKTFRADSAFSSWLYRIAENVCIDYFRKQQRAYDIEPLHTVNERCITQTHSDPCRDLERQELRAYLRTAIQRLTQTRRQVFLLYYDQDLLSEVLTFTCAYGSTSPRFTCRLRREDSPKICEIRGIHVNPRFGQKMSYFGDEIYLQS